MYLTAARPLAERVRTVARQLAEVRASEWFWLRTRQRRPGCPHPVTWPARAGLGRRARDLAGTPRSGCEGCRAEALPPLLADVPGEVAAAWVSACIRSTWLPGRSDRAGPRGRCVPGLAGRRPARWRPGRGSPTNPGGPDAIIARPRRACRRRYRYPELAVVHLCQERSRNQAGAGHLERRSSSHQAANS